MPHLSDDELDALAEADPHAPVTATIDVYQKVDRSGREFHPLRLPLMIGSIAALMLCMAVVILVVQSIIEDNETDARVEQNVCEAAYDQAVYEAGAAARRTSTRIFVEIVDQLVTDDATNYGRYELVIRDQDRAAAYEDYVLAERDAWVQSGRPLPCKAHELEDTPTVLAPPRERFSPPTTTTTTSTTTSTTPTTTTTTVPATTVPATVRPAPVTVLPRPTTTTRPILTTTTLDCPGNSNNCNSPCPGNSRNC